MRPLRVLVSVVVIVSALGASALFATSAARMLRSTPVPTQPTPVSPQHQSRRWAQRHRWHAHPHRRQPTPRQIPVKVVPAAYHGPGLLHLSGVELALIVGLEIAGGTGLVGLALVALVARRVRARRRRGYSLYELHLSTHDEAKPQDLEDMLEAIAHVIRAFPGERARNGQPYVALELICSADPNMEWSINVRCEPDTVRALDAAISAAYPDVRLGRRHAESPLPRPVVLRVPGYVMRFRKERSFLYPLLAAQETLGSPPLEQIARAQVGLGAPSVVRFQLTPTPSYFEELARRLHRRRERGLMRHQRWGDFKGGLLSTLDRDEMGGAQRTQNRSLFWLEVVIAADSAQACKTVAAAVQSRRGENRLHRRWMLVRQNLYRRRFPKALGPLLPSTRSLVSAAEAAHLLALPSARMKGVPVRRLTLPRIPVPPEITRANRIRRAPPIDTQPPSVAAPPTAHTLDTANLDPVAGR